MYFVEVGDGNGAPIAQFIARVSVGRRYFAVNVCTILSQLRTLGGRSATHTRHSNELTIGYNIPGYGCKR